jgi:hypothetical protein
MDMKITVSDEKPKFLDTISYSDYRTKVEEIFYAEVMSHKEYKNIDSSELVLNDSQKAYNNCKNHI